MSQKNSNGIIRTMFILSEKFKILNITDDDLLEISKEQNFIHIFSDAGKGYL